MNAIPPKRTVSKFKRVTLAVVIAGVGLAFIGGYILYQTKNLIRGPEIVIESPAKSLISDKSNIEIKGTTERIAHLFLNGRRIFTDEGGRFVEKLLLAPGYNIIRLEAKDKFGRRTSQVLELVYRPAG